MRTFITALALMLATSASALEYSDWPRDLFRMYSQLDELRDALKEVNCEDTPEGDCEERVSSFAEQIDVMIGRAEAVAGESDYEDSEGNVLTDGLELVSEVRSFAESSQ